MEKLIFISSSLILFYVWIGYYLLIKMLIRFFPEKELNFNEEKFTPFVSILVPAYNEADVIEKRISNLLDSNYPKELMEIMIGSDGSTDKTVAIASKYKNQNVRVFDFKQNRGRSSVHNGMVKMAKGSILVFTDADTKFKTTFLKNIVKPFSLSNIGAVVGRLIYDIQGGDIAKNEKKYWNYEIKIKEAENKLGLINTGTGACMAIRKNLFTPLTPVSDIDCAAVIDIILRGYRIHFAKDAIAYDNPPHKAKTEFKMRVRGTSKFLTGVGQRTTCSNLLKNPGLFWSLSSHRLLRYTTPFLMIVLFLSNLMILNHTKSEIFFKLTFIIQVTFYICAVIGLIGNILKKEVSIASSVFSFCVAMSGMMAGVTRAVLGKPMITYKTDDSF